MKKIKKMISFIAGCVLASNICLSGVWATTYSGGLPAGTSFGTTPSGAAGVTQGNAAQSSPAMIQSAPPVAVQSPVVPAAGLYTPQQLLQISSYYSNTVFVGDSVMVGFRNYCAKSPDPTMKQIKFLASGSYSLHNAFWPVSSKSVHPLYMGKQQPVWESVRQMGAQRVFLFFGINDMFYGVEETLSYYLQMIAKIKEYVPQAEINIVSATYTLEGVEKGLLNNANLVLFNTNMQALAAKNGWGYMDIATPLSDGRGNLSPVYCSDKYLHQTYAAYDIWRMVAYRYAASRLGF